MQGVHAHLVGCQSSRVNGRHRADDGNQGDHHNEDVFCVHRLDVGKAPDNQRPQPQEVNCGKEKPNHLNFSSPQTGVSEISRIAPKFAEVGIPKEVFWNMQPLNQEK